MSFRKTTALHRQAKVLTSGGISSSEKLLALTIADHENEGSGKFNTRQGACKAAIPQLSVETGLSYSYVAEALLGLTRRGLLVRYDRGVLPAWYAINQGVLDYFEDLVEDARLAFAEKQKDIAAWRRDKDKFSLIEVELPAGLLAERDQSSDSIIAEEEVDDPESQVEVDPKSVFWPRRFVNLQYALWNLPSVGNQLEEQEAGSVAQTLVSKYDERLPMLACLGLRSDEEQLRHIAKADNVPACLQASLENMIRAFETDSPNPEHIEQAAKGIVSGKYKYLNYMSPSERFCSELTKRANISLGEPEIGYNREGFPIVKVPALFAQVAA